MRCLIGFFKVGFVEKYGRNYIEFAISMQISVQWKFPAVIKTFKNSNLREKIKCLYSPLIHRVFQPFA